MRTSLVVDNGATYRHGFVAGADRPSLQVGCSWIVNCVAWLDTHGQTTIEANAEAQAA